MLDSDTKRRIDTARDILVGKVPDPKSQVEQITTALIYKFMDDMDAQAEELGGKRKFFAKEFARYGWAKLISPSVGGHELIGLYGEGIAKMPENPGIPTLFRDIFKNAYLPYRDPETLKSFLKVINEFEYDHSERLGDAFEYLLSVLGSQGDAGQFRTPRHIIDFIVRIVDPKKNETILDPACGTAGFLISAWKHINKENTKNGHAALTPDERKKLAAGIRGYDIDPTMVKLSRANMYLHGFADPHIFEYDTLTSLEKWNETADVILANPPFMSPKGGIKPHNRFGVESKRSEVLFVDYMAEHLTPSGRAGIIVPEGIIFQSQTAYTDLRKMLVNEYLVAVISLPAGVFNPYSGVKTSILILDRSLAKQSSSIGFFKIENDGFGLGAQRREVKGEQLTQVAAEIGEYLGRLRGRRSVEDFEPTLGLIVPKANIAENGDFNLSGERYGADEQRSSQYPHVPLGEVVEILDYQRRPITKDDRKPGPYPYYGATGIVDHVEGFLFDEPLVLVGEDGAKWGPGERSAFAVEGKVWVNNHAHVLRPNRDRVLDRFLIEILNEADLSQYITGVTVPKLNQEKLRGIEIPLPPLEVQREIVAEIEGYQKVIDGARAVLDHYRPHIPIRPEWPMVELGKVATLLNGRAYKQEELLDKGPTPVLRVGNFFSNRNWYYSDLVLEEDKYCNEGDLLYAWSASFGPRIWEGPRAIYHYHIWKIEVTDAIDKRFLYHLLAADSEKIKAEGNGIAMTHATKGGMEMRKFPLPPLETQQQVVAEIEAEQRLVAANRELVARFEKKIQAAIARVWGEEPTPSAAPTPATNGEET